MYEKKIKYRKQHYKKKNLLAILFLIWILIYFMFKKNIKLYNRS